MPALGRCLFFTGPLQNTPIHLLPPSFAPPNTSRCFAAALPGSLVHIVLHSTRRSSFVHREKSAADDLFKVITSALIPEVSNGGSSE